MKEFTKKIGSLLLAVLLTVTLAGNKVYAEEWVGGTGAVPKKSDLGRITVEDIEDDNTVIVKAYQVTEAVYGTNNTGFLKYQVVGGDQPKVEIADPLKPTSEEITAIAQTIKTKGLYEASLTYNSVTDTWYADVAPGYWVVVVTNKVSADGKMDYIYNPMLAGVYYKSGTVQEFEKVTEEISSGSNTYDVYTDGTYKYVVKNDNKYYKVNNDGTISATAEETEPSNLVLSKVDVKVKEVIDGYDVFVNKNDSTKKYVLKEGTYYPVENGVISAEAAETQPAPADLENSYVSATGDILMMDPTPISANSNWRLAGTNNYAKRDQITPEKKIVDNSKKENGADVATKGREDGLNDEVVNQHGDDHAPADEVTFEATTKIPAYSEAYRNGKVIFNLYDTMDENAFKLLVGAHADPNDNNTSAEEKEAIDKIHGGKRVKDPEAPATEGVPFHKIIVTVGSEVYEVAHTSPYTQHIYKKVFGYNVKTNGTEEYVVLDGFDHDNDNTTSALTGNYKVDGYKLAEPLTFVTPGTNDTDVELDVFTLTYDAKSWQIAFAKDYIIDHAGANVSVKYDALLLDGMTRNYDENINVFKVRFSTDTDGNYEEDEDRTFHYTFEIDGKLDGEIEEGGEHTKRLGHELVKTDENFEDKYPGAVDEENVGLRVIKYNSGTDANPVWSWAACYPEAATTPAGYETGVYYNGTYNENSKVFKFNDGPTKAVAWDVEEFQSWTSGVVKMGLDDAEFKLTLKALPDGTLVQKGKEYTTKTVAGRMNFSGLDAGYYELEETKAPDGYSLNPQKYTVKISAEYYQTNQYHKVDESGNKLYIQADGTTVGTTETTTPAMTAEENEYLLFYKGELKKYTIERAQSAFTTAEAFTGTATEKTVYQESRVHNNSGKYNSTIEEEFVGAEATFIKNTKNPFLPSTGGIGTYLFTFAGVAILALASFMLIFKRREQH